MEMKVRKKRNIRTDNLEIRSCLQCGWAGVPERIAQIILS